MGIWGKTLTGPAGTLACLAVLTALILAMVPAGASNDLRALWLAAEAFRTGGPVYPSGDLFTMTAPSAWTEAHPGETLYPYLYPPLWAGLLAPFTDALSFEATAGVFRVLNAALLAASTFLAWRLTGSRLPFAVFGGVAALLLTQTFVGSLALMENQPQILVSFLILCALERQKSGACVMAGAILAVAAALKVYPVLIAVLWLATGKRHATLAFALTGAGLGGLSVALAGWPLHTEFLATLATIGNTVLLTPVSYALTPALAQLFALDAFTYQTGSTGGWLVLELLPSTSTMARVLLLVALAALALAMRKADRGRQNALLWPLALVTISLLAPLSWAYHYIPALACAPILLDRAGPRAGAALLFATALPLSPLASGLALDMGVPAQHLQIAGTAALLALAISFAALASRTPDTRPA